MLGGSPRHKTITNVTVWKCTHCPSIEHWRERTQSNHQYMKCGQRGKYPQKVGQSNMLTDPSKIAPAAGMKIQLRTLPNLALDWDKLSHSHNGSTPSNKEGALYPPNRTAGWAHSSPARCGERNKFVSPTGNRVSITLLPRVWPTQRTDWATAVLKVITEDTNNLRN